MTSQEAIELEAKCDRLMTEYTGEKCTVCMSLVGHLKIVFEENYILIDEKSGSVLYIRFNGYYQELCAIIKDVQRCFRENKSDFDQLIVSYLE